MLGLDEFWEELSGFERSYGRRRCGCFSMKATIKMDSRTNSPHEG